MNLFIEISNRFGVLGAFVFSIKVSSLDEIKFIRVQTILDANC